MNLIEVTMSRVVAKPQVQKDARTDEEDGSRADEQNADTEERLQTSGGDEKEIGCRYVAMLPGGADRYLP